MKPVPKPAAVAPALFQTRPLPPPARSPRNISQWEPVVERLKTSALKEGDYMLVARKPTGSSANQARRRLLARSPHIEATVRNRVEIWARWNKRLPAKKAKV